MRKIEIHEVGPRDGFQNVGEYIPLKDKLEIIEGLVRAGVRHIQVTSFVSPNAIPQMRDAGELAEACLRLYPDTDIYPLVPNLRGARNAWDAGMRKVSYVVSLSESHNRVNINRTHEQSLSELQLIRDELPDMRICLDLATTFGCPFEGVKSEREVVDFLLPYVQQSPAVVNLCDTIGIAHPAQVRRTIDFLREAYPSIVLQLHVHDTRNMGMVNTLAGIERGVCSVQSTLGGLGGCPYAPGASGNLATEDLVWMLNNMGYETGINSDALIDLAKRQVGLIPQGKFSGHLYAIPNEGGDQ